jgi:hypothetical protein
MSCAASRAQTAPSTPTTRIRIVCSFSDNRPPRRYEAAQRRASLESGHAGGVLGQGGALMLLIAGCGTPYITFVALRSFRRRGRRRPAAGSADMACPARDVGRLAARPLTGGDGAVVEDLAAPDAVRFGCRVRRAAKLLHMTCHQLPGVGAGWARLLLAGVGGAPGEPMGVHDGVASRVGRQRPAPGAGRRTPD